MIRRALAALLLLAACRGRSGSDGGAAGADPLAEAHQFLEQGQADAALARLQGASQPEALVLQGQAWVMKAAKAPLPTAPPAPSPLPRGAVPPAPPEFKPEELQAIDCFERAATANPRMASAHLALAGLLAPHAVARQQQEAAAAARRPAGRGSATPEPVPLAPAGPDVSAERVVREYRMAAEAEPANASVVEAWILFATSVGRLEDADAGLRELLKREKEKPEPFVRYGDFLLASRKDAVGAIAQYEQALIWKPDDQAVRAKVADIFLGMAADHLAQKQYASAEARLKDAQRYVSESSSQASKLQELQAQVAQIRGRPAGR